MLNIAIRLAVAICLLVLIVLAVGYFLPRDFEIESSIDIAAPPDRVFEMLNSLPEWQHWSTWNEERVEGLAIRYGKIKEGVGAVQTWTDARGSGKLWITKSEPSKSLEYKLKFGDFPEMFSRLELFPSQSGTRIEWTSEGSLPDGAFYGYSALLFPIQMTHQYEQSLNRLKEIIE